MLPLAQWTQKTDSCLMQTMFDQHVMMSPVSHTMQQNILTNFRSPIVKRKITLVFFYVREEQGHPLSEVRSMFSDNIQHSLPVAVMGEFF